MRMKPLLAGIAVVALGVGADVARADAPPHELAGQPFYFSASCSGIGDVILVNQSLARTAALRVLGSHVVVQLGRPGIDKRATDVCTLAGGGFSPESIEPFEEPFVVPVVIVGA